MNTVVIKHNITFKKHFIEYIVTDINNQCIDNMAL